MFQAPAFPIVIPTSLRSPCAALYVPNNSKHPNRFIPPSTPPPTKNIIDFLLAQSVPTHPLSPPKCVERELSQGQISSFEDIDKFDQDMCIATMMSMSQNTKQHQWTQSEHIPINISELYHHGVVQNHQPGQPMESEDVPQPNLCSPTVDPRISKLTYKDHFELKSKLSSLVSKYNPIGVSTMRVQNGLVQYRIKFLHRQKGIVREIEFSSQATRKLSIFCGRDLLLPFLQQKMNNILK